AREAGPGTDERSAAPGHRGARRAPHPRPLRAHADPLRFLAAAGLPARRCGRALLARLHRGRGALRRPDAGAPRARRRAPGRAGAAARAHLRARHPLMPDTTETARREELDRALRLLERGRDPEVVLEELSRRLMNKLLHAPTKALLDES